MSRKSWYSTWLVLTAGWCYQTPRRPSSSGPRGPRWAPCGQTACSTPACRSASTGLYCTVLYCTVLYCTVLHCTVLHCTIVVFVSGPRLLHPRASSAGAAPAGQGHTGQTLQDWLQLQGEPNTHLKNDPFWIFIFFLHLQNIVLPKNKFKLDYGRCISSQYHGGWFLK